MICKNGCLDLGNEVEEQKTRIEDPVYDNIQSIGFRVSKISTFFFGFDTKPSIMILFV